MIRLFTITLFILTLIIPTELWGRGLSIQQTPDSISLLSPNEGVMQKQESWWKQKSDYTTEFRPTQLIAPAALFAIGALGIGEDSPPLRKLNLSIRQSVGELRGDCYAHFDDYLQYLPVASYLGLCALPVKAKHTFAERVCVGVVAYLSMTALVNGLKYTIREPRPDNGKRNSFPSGHTATAFTGAELVRAEYGWAYGVPAYIIAAGVGFMRIYNDRHWFNDVLAGAAVGIISARIGYWLLPLSRKLFNLKSSSAVAISPLYYPEQSALGASCSLVF